MSKKTKTTSKPAAEYAPFIMGGANAVQDAYSQNAGNVQNATNQITGLLPSMIQKYQAGDAGVNAARNYNVDVLGGRYLNSNPEFDNVVNRSVNDTVNAGQASLGLRGLTGGSSYADILSRNAGNVASDLRYTDYNNERQRMATAAGQAPSMAAADVIQMSPMLATLQASQAPMQAAGGYSNSLAGLLSPYQEQVQRGAPMGYFMQALGSAAAAYGAGG
jgi:hypothetical protein